MGESERNFQEKIEEEIRLITSEHQEIKRKKQKSELSGKRKNSLKSISPYKSAFKILNRDSATSSHLRRSTQPFNYYISGKPSYKSHKNLRYNT